MMKLSWTTIWTETEVLMVLAGDGDSSIMFVTFLMSIYSLTMTILQRRNLSQLQRLRHLSLLHLLPGLLCWPVILLHHLLLLAVWRCLKPLTMLKLGMLLPSFVQQYVPPQVAAPAPQEVEATLPLLRLLNRVWRELPLLNMDC